MLALTPRERLRRLQQSIHATPRLPPRLDEPIVETLGVRARHGAECVRVGGVACVLRGAPMLGDLACGTLRGS